MRPSIKLIHVLNALLLLALASGCGGSAQPTATPQAAAAIQLEDCQLSSPGTAVSIPARCGKLPVFEDQAQQSGRKIDLKVAVIPAVSKSPLPDALFLLAGGPGQAATETFPQLISVFDRLHQKRDIVLVDQRGTGGSHPLRCAESDAQEAGGTTETSPEQQDEQLKECLAGLDADTRLYTTAATVADLEQARAALGYESVDLVGISYGTRVALAYQRQYPQRTRTVTLDSVNPLEWELGPQNPANAQQALEWAFERCAADAACESAFPHLQDEFRTLLACLDAQPRQVSLSDPTTGEMTQVELTHSSLATTLQLLSYTPETVALIPLLIHTAVARDDYSLLAAQYLIATEGLGQTLYDGLYLSVLCAEDAPFYPASPQKVNSYLPDHTQDLVRECAIWPHATASAEFKQPVKSDVPTLILSGEADPITPPANAEQVHQNLPNSLSLVVPGIGHNVIFRGCVPKVAASFIESGSLAGLDTSCVKDIQPAPFMVNFAGSEP